MIDPTKRPRCLSRTRGFGCTVHVCACTVLHACTLLYFCATISKIETKLIMEAWERDLLRRHHSFLLRSLEPDTVRRALYQQDLLTQCEHDNIRAEATQMSANELILEALKRRAPGTLERFCAILREEPGHQHVVDKLMPGA